MAAYLLIGVARGDSEHVGFVSEHFGPVPLTGLHAVLEVVLVVGAEGLCTGARAETGVTLGGARTRTELEEDSGAGGGFPDSLWEIWQRFSVSGYECQYAGNAITILNGSLATSPPLNNNFQKGSITSERLFTTLKTNSNQRNAVK